MQVFESQNASFYQKQLAAMTEESAKAHTRLQAMQEERNQLQAALDSKLEAERRQPAAQECSDEKSELHGVPVSAAEGCQPVLTSSTSQSLQAV